jgi:hypothetical protein
LNIKKAYILQRERKTKRAVHDSFGNGKGGISMDEKSIIQKGLQAAKEAAANAGMTEQVDQLANKLGQPGQTAQANSTTNQKDGFRYNYDDASDV